MYIRGFSRTAADSAEAKLTIVVGQATGKVILPGVSLVHDHS